MNNYLYIGVKGHVVCLDKRTGKEIWKRHLKSRGLTNLVIQNDLIIAQQEAEQAAAASGGGAS